MKNVASISPRQLAARRAAREPCDLIDVRTPAEFQEVHVAGARNVPLDSLDASAAASMRSAGSEAPIYVICRSGGRGRTACERLTAAGMANVANVEGGTLACVDAGLPVVRGQAVMSLERQVRIAAGSLVLLGIALAWLVHPALIGISAFVGAGLVFAGVTDTCGMGMILARMSWNRRRSPAESRETT